MDSSNILVTAIGSMAAPSVLHSLRRLGGVKAVVGCDIHSREWLSTGAAVDRFYCVPNADDREYVVTLLDIAQKHKIDYIFPLTDPEVDVLSVGRGDFQSVGALICISPEDAITGCRDKSRVPELFAANMSVNTIPTFTELDAMDSCFVDGPIIAKPKKGRSSEGVFYLAKEDIEHLRNKGIRDYVFQPDIHGDVHTVDCIQDMHGNQVAIPRRELIRTANGAGLTVSLGRNAQLERAAREICSTLSIVGCINIEFICDGEDYYVMDINPRFSAGVGFSILAGCNVVAEHLKCFQGARIDTTGKYRAAIMTKEYVDSITEYI